MRRTYFGIPLWALLVVGAGGGYWLVRRRRTKAAEQAASQQSAQTAQAASGPSGDPFLTAYQAGESSGVATYAAGVSSGISLVDSIMGMFPGGDQTAQAGGAGSAASSTGGNIGTGSGGGATTQATGSAGPPVVGKTPTGSPIFSIGSTGYDIQRGGSPGAVDLLRGGKFIGSYWIPSSGYTKTAGGLEISQAGDKAPGAVDVSYQAGNKFIGAYQT